MNEERSQNFIGYLFGIVPLHGPIGHTNNKMEAWKGYKCWIRPFVWRIVLFTQQGEKIR